MAITLNAVATLAKNYAREVVSDTVGTPLMEDYARSTYLDWCQELHWPEGTLTQNSVANTQEYQLPDSLNAIFRVYMNGQRIPATTIALLEGDAVGNYDPTWRVLPAITVPALTSGSGSSIPITAGEGFARMQYYLRGGSIGFVPKPAAIYEIKIEGSVFPPNPNSGDILVLPDQFKDGLAYGSIVKFLLSDRRADEAQHWNGLAELEWAKAMRWRRRMAGTDQLPAFIPNDYRGHFNIRNRGTTVAR